MTNKEETNIDRAINYMQMEYPSFNKKRKEVGQRILNRIKSYPDNMSVVELINAMAYITVTWN